MKNVIRIWWKELYNRVISWMCKQAYGHDYRKVAEVFEGGIKTEYYICRRCEKPKQETS